MGLNQPSAMLLLLKMKRTKRITAMQVALEDDKIQQVYNVGDLLEVLCQLPPLADVLARLARKAFKSKEEILMNMRGLFKSEFLNITQKAANYVVINGFGRLPSKYQETLLELRCEVFENIDGFLANIESFSSSRVKMAKSFTSLLKSVLWFCAILEPEIEVDNQFSRSSFASQERIHNISINTTISQIQEIPVARKVSFHNSSGTLVIFT